jgi:hypothetical protein
MGSSSCEPAIRPGDALYRSVSMTQADFAAAVLGWHDFFLASAGASAALLGLLFVGVSINLGAIAARERVDLRAKAGLAFSNLIYVLMISLLLLVADPEAHGLAIGLGAIAGLGLVRVIGHLRVIIRAQRRLRDQLPTLRRIGWTIAADLVLGYVAVVLYAAGDARVIVLIVAAVFILLIGASDIAWEMLVQVSQERDR